MSKKKKRIFLTVWLLLLVLTGGGALLLPSAEKHESIQEVMRDAVMHEANHIRFLGMDVNPAVISAFTITGIVLAFALLMRLFVVPRFKRVPGPVQLLLEEWVGLFDGMAKSNSPHRNKFLGLYLFAAGSYVFLSTCFELLGLQTVTTEGYSIAMPAPLADINGAIAMGVTSYLFILSGGIAGNGIKGVGNTLKDFSLPISMSFRLFGALLSGLMVTELVYYSIKLSFVLPVFVGIMFTLLHALIQAYVLTMLTGLFYGEVSEPPAKAE